MWEKFFLIRYLRLKKKHCISVFFNAGGSFHILFDEFVFVSKLILIILCLHFLD